MIEEIRNVQRALDLLAQHLFHARMVVTQSIHADTGQQIQIAFVGTVDENGAASAVDQDVVARIGSQDVLAFKLFYVCQLHESKRLAYPRNSLRHRSNNLEGLMLKEFKEFAMRGNVMDLAVGVIIGAAFGAVVTSLVGDIIMPPIGMLMGGWISGICILRSTGRSTRVWTL